MFKAIVSFQAFVFVLIVAGVGGWIANVVKLVGMLHGDVSAMLIVRAVGIFAAPIGAVLGFF